MVIVSLTSVAVDHTRLDMTLQRLKKKKENDLLKKGKRKLKSAVHKVTQKAFTTLRLFKHTCQVTETRINFYTACAFG